MAQIIFIFHWISYVYIVYIFGYASLYKVLEIPNMMEGMLSFGFNRVWTLVIGYGELLTLLGLLLGLWYHPLKNGSTIGMLLFGVGALMVHFAHQDYSDFYDALLACIASVVLLLTDKHFRISL